MNANICVIIIDINRLTYGRTSVYNLNYHLIWGTKYRNKVLKGHVETVLKRTLYEIASKYGFTIAHMEIGKDDHIHLLVSAPSELSVTNIMRWLKGISAWQLFRECPELQTSHRRSRIVICGHRVTMLKASAQSMNRLLPGILINSVEKW